MSDLVATAYEDLPTAQQVIQVPGTVIQTSLSNEDEQAPKPALDAARA